MGKRNFRLSVVSVCTLMSAIGLATCHDKLHNASQYFIDDVMRFSTVECWQQDPVPEKPPAYTRVALVGDATTLGAGGQRSRLHFDYDHHLQMDGSKAGFQGFPYLLSELFKEHNLTQRYQFLNFATDNFTLLSDPNVRTYQNTCEYQQLLSSKPDIIVSMLGAKESMSTKTFTPDLFIAKYQSFIKEMRNAFPNVQFILITPLYSMASVLSQAQPFRLNQLDPKDFQVNNPQFKKWEFAQTNMANLVRKIAQVTSIPEEQIVDSERLLKVDNEDTMVSEILPNHHGNAVLAQEVYEKMAFAPAIKNIVKSHHFQFMDMYQWHAYTSEMNQIRAKNDAQMILQKKSKNYQKNLLQTEMEVIGLSDKCHDQSYKEGKLARLPGHRFMFQVPTPQPAPPVGNEIRIAVVGDQLTQGLGSSMSEQIDKLPLIQRLSDQSDGSYHGQHGWPFLLHQLLQNNNQSTSYTLMNFGVSGASIMPGLKEFSFFKDCRYEQLQKSQANFVFFGFGGMDQHTKNYTEEKFISEYVKLIKQTQNLPTKPMIFLMVPTFTCKHKIIMENSTDFINEPSKCTKEQSKDLHQTILTIANQTQIPKEQIVNAWALTRESKDGQNRILDWAHPNLRGHGEIAQDFFMKMSFSPQYMERQKQILEGQFAPKDQQQRLSDFDSLAQRIKKSTSLVQKSFNLPY